MFIYIYIYIGRERGNRWGKSCSASSILRSMNISKIVDSCIITDEASQADGSVNIVDDPLLEAAIKQSREEEKEILIAKATTEDSWEMLQDSN